ncbi:MAG: RNA polymerase factor sigma-32 [Alphaproteobacteria bacterium]|nr:RNA polymerase factor sigma-32 [Alphaproteobacteria bacterium]
MACVDTQETLKANRRFIRTAMRAPVLSREREVELARAWRVQQNEGALHELITSYMRLVIAIAGRYRHYGLPMGDIVQEGNIGLMQAAARFDPDREVRFSTYACWWVRSAIQDHILRNWSIVRTGTTAGQKALFFNLRRLRAQIAAADGPLSPQARQQIAGLVSVDEAEVAHMEARLGSADRSLNAAVGEEGELEWQDLLADDRLGPEEAVAQLHDSAMRNRWLSEAMGRLSERERTIIEERRLREDEATLESLGQWLGISKERVRQIEHEAMRKLKYAIIQRAGSREAVLSAA